ncbi:MAG TPA: NADH:flavin oxidoreductase [Candidatus Limnocylindrales bacterium]|nr:NADH:flavin oxidoreductase [Candidatus Limnocylindrales bacterium]
MPSPFDPASIGRLQLTNRFVRSATWEGMADPNGAPTDRLISLYETLAEGGAGLLITGYAFVHEGGKQLSRTLGMHSDSLVPLLSALTRRVHDKGGTIVAQLYHGGGQANRKSSGLAPIAPSALSLPQYPEIPVEMSREDIRATVAAFARAAARAREAGFDGVQLHGAHGYLISQFLSPITNRRTDEYGGTPENRSRFLAKVVRAVRNSVGSEYPVWVKLNGDDFLQGGFALEEAVPVARMLEREGIDAIEVSGGTPASGDRTPARTRIDSAEKEAYHRELARAVKRAVGVPVGLVGGLRSPSVIEETFRAGDADFFSMARPLIREPGLIRRWASGDFSRSACVSCNGCFGAGLGDDGIRCVQRKRDG